MATPNEQYAVGSEISDTSSNHAVSSELNSLANAALVLSSVINTDGHFSNIAGDGAGNGAPAFAMRLHLEAVGTAFTSSVIDGWFLQAIDGSVYDTGSSTITPAAPVHFSFPVIAQTAAQDVTILVPSVICGKIKLLVRNNTTGQALASSGNYIAIYPVRPTAPSV